jgi:hypothetical protein
MMPAPMNATPRSHAPSPGACLDDLLASRFLPKRWIERIWSARELPPRLRRCTRDLKPGTEWRAYGEEGRIFFAIARMHAAGPDAGSSTAIDAYFLDENAAVYAAGVWDHDEKTGWCLDAVIEPSYDSDRGWWLGELTGPELGIGPAADAGPAAAAVEFRPRKLRG